MDTSVYRRGTAADRRSRSLEKGVDTLFLMPPTFAPANKAPTTTTYLLACYKKSNKMTSNTGSVPDPLRQYITVVDSHGP